MQPRYAGLNPLNLMKGVYQKWSEDNVSRLAASLAYFTVFSLPPMLMIVIAIAGFVFGRDAATGELLTQFQGLVGTDGAKVIQDLVRNADQSPHGTRATIISIITLFVGASGIFIALQDALNTIWGVKPKPGLGIGSYIRQRLLSFTLVVCIGFVLLVSLVISAALAAFSHWLSARFPEGGPLLQVMNFFVSFGITTGMFAIMFKVLPDVVVPWRGVVIGAIVTATLFNAGKLAIGLYLGNSTTASVYGAAGSLVVLLIWIYYSSQIFLIGAVFTSVYAPKVSHPESAPHAEPVTPEARLREGLTPQRHGGAKA